MYMTTTLQQTIDERISSLKEQINHDKKRSEANITLQIEIDAIRSVENDIEKVESIILQKKTLLKNCKDMHELDRLFAEPDGLQWLQQWPQTAAYCSGK